MCIEIEKLAMKNIYKNEEKYTEMFGLLNKLIQLKVHSELIEEWYKSQNFFKNLESLLSFNFSDTSVFIKLLEEARKEFVNNPENKKIKSETKKLNAYYSKFIHFFRNSFVNKEFFLEDSDLESKSGNRKPLNPEFSSFKENKLNMPEFVFEKIKEFLQICLFKNQEDVQCSDCKIKITVLLRKEVLDNIFNGFKAFLNNDSVSYIDHNNKLYDLNDLIIIQFYMVLHDILMDKILDNKDFFDQISVNNW